MAIGDAEIGVETPRARPEGSGRKPLEQGMGVSSATAGSSISQPEANVRLMELVVSRENMMAAYIRVVGNKGAAGVDKMTVTDLKPFLVEHWPRIEEELLEDRYQPQAVRGVEIPKPGGGVRLLGMPTAVDRLVQRRRSLTPLHGAQHASLPISSITA